VPLRVENKRPPPRKSVALFSTSGLTILGGTILAVLYLWDPQETSFYPPCVFRWLTGWQCPGCGSTRAIHQLLHGHLKMAWFLNPLMVTLLPFIAYGLTSDFLRFVRGKGLPAPRIPAGWIWAGLLMGLVFTVWRNSPGASLIPH